MTNTSATIDIIYPDDERLTEPRLSTPPLSGSFYVSCYNIDGNKYDTQDIEITTVTAKTFKAVLESDCSFLEGNIEVSELTTTYNKRSMGVEF